VYLKTQDIVLPAVSVTVLNVITSLSIGPEALTKTHASTLILSPLSPGSRTGLTLCSETAAPVN